MKKMLLGVSILSTLAFGASNPGDNGASASGQGAARVTYGGKSRDIT